MKGRDFLRMLDVSRGDLEALLDLAAELKAGRAGARAEAGHAVALVFEKPSLRTKSSLMVGAARLGLLPVYLGPDEVGLGKRESIPDAARNLDKWFSLVVHRTFEQARVEELARHSAVPVINALSDDEHPCQVLADLLTLRERFGRLDGLEVAWVGDGNNVCRSLLGAAALCGLQVRVATPERRVPSSAGVEAARAAGAEIRLFTEPEPAVDGAHAIYTDTWISMGQEKEAEARRREFQGFRVDAALMGRARPDAVFLHCLPAHRGEEVTDEVMDSAASLVFEQAANRLPTQQALMQRLLGIA